MDNAQMLAELLRHKESPERREARIAAARAILEALWKVAKIANGTDDFLTKVQATAALANDARARKYSDATFAKVVEAVIQGLEADASGILDIRLGPDGPEYVKPATVDALEDGDLLSLPGPKKGDLLN